MNETPFFELYARGEVSADEIGRYVEQWHEGATKNARESTLAGYLGFTESEYAQWVQDPDALPLIRDARRRAAH